MGGTKVQMPQAPTAPTATQTAQDYASALPIYYQAALQYEPQIAQMQQQIQQQLYPFTSDIQEQLAKTAQQGYSAEAPSWYRQNIRDTLASQLGRNLVYNPQGQEQFGLATNQAMEDWKRYYQNLGLTLSGRQPLTQPSNMMQSYTPAAGMGYASNIYGTQGNIYGTQMQNYTSQSQYNPWMNVGGSLLGGVGQGLGSIGGMASYGYGSKQGWW